MTIETKHTPGPWRIGSAVNGFASSVEAPNVAKYSHLTGREGAMTVCTMASRSKDHYAEMDANARLIAASPSLLEALRAIEARTVRLDNPVGMELLPMHPQDALENDDAVAADPNAAVVALRSWVAALDKQLSEVMAVARAAILEAK